VDVSQHDQALLEQVLEPVVEQTARLQAHAATTQDKDVQHCKQRADGVDAEAQQQSTQHAAMAQNDKNETRKRQADMRQGAKAGTDIASA
jgi:hypothetical protein